MEDNLKTKESIFKNGLDMLYLANCALCDMVPQKEVMEVMDLAAVYATAKNQTMAAVAFYGLENWLNSPESESFEVDEDLLKKWQQTRDMAIRKNTMLDIAREQLFAYMDEHEIWHMPLKGSLLKDMYPKLGMRQMADNDILIDAAYRKQVFDYMVGLGYEGKYHDAAAHDEFLKKPFYNFEIHNVLVSQNKLPAFAEYYKNIKDKLIKAEGYAYYFRDEDFYIYMMAHAYKHHSGSGNGVRHIMDVKVFLDKKPSLDWQYINCELEKLEIAEYEATVRTLADKIFDSNCRIPNEIKTLLKTDELDLLSFSLGAGTYGTIEIRVENNWKKYAKGKQATLINKFKYFWGRLTWEEALYSEFPKLAKYKILHPVLYVLRAIKVLICRRDRLSAEIKVVRNVSTDDVKK